MPEIEYSAEHLQRLQQFFGNPEINAKLQLIIRDFPNPETVSEFNNTLMGQLHTKIIKKLIHDIYVNYRVNLLTWSEVTKQTPIVDPEYLSMHLVSIFTGIPGTGTAARGYDLSDRSEVKSSSRVEQLGKCRQCGSTVTTLEEVCGNCGSGNILRKFDSHWIFSLRTTQEVDSLLSRPAIYLVLIDYENIETRDIIRIRIWKLDPNDIFVQSFLRDYYFSEFYQQRIERGETPAPCNLHPEKPLTKFLKPCLLFRAQVNFRKEDTDINIQLINSEGICEVLNDRDIPALRRGKFFLKVRDLGLESEFHNRIRELTG
jgi:hypothetical protein